MDSVGRKMGADAETSFPYASRTYYPIRHPSTSVILSVRIP